MTISAITKTLITKRQLWQRQKQTKYGRNSNRGILIKA